MDPEARFAGGGSQPVGKGKGGSGVAEGSATVIIENTAVPAGIVVVGPPALRGGYAATINHKV